MSDGNRDVKKESISIRIKREDKQYIESEALKSGMNLSNYIISTMTGRQEQAELRGKVINAVCEMQTCLNEMLIYLPDTKRKEAERRMNRIWQLLK